MTHVHFSDHAAAIFRIADQLATEYSSGSFVEEEENIAVVGLNEESQVEVKNAVVTIAARTLYHHAFDLFDTAQDCASCKQQFLQLLKTHQREIALRIMDILRGQNRASSCEHILFDNVTKNVLAVMRQSASLSTQQVIPPPPVYFGLFDRLCEVQQREFAISSAVSHKSVLATWHLADCIAAVGFDKEAKVGFLFHIDYSANISAAMRRFTSLLTQRQYQFEYFLTGGATGHVGRTLNEVERYFTNASNENLRFIKRQQPEGLEIPYVDFTKDSYWSQSVRLHRSIAIDLTLEDPLSQWIGYEPEINPYSAFHTREQTSEEADAFCMSSPLMKCILTPS